MKRESADRVKVRVIRLNRLGIPVCHMVTFGAVALVAVVLTCPTWVSSSFNTGGSPAVEAQIADAVGLHIVKGSVKWITHPKSGNFRDARTWYDLVFLGGTEPNAPSDLYRMAVRSINGAGIFAARDLKNLSVSPAGDESELAVESPFAAAATRALGQVRSISIFDFSGAPKSEEPESALDRLRAHITNTLETGKPEGIGKTTIRFTSAPQSAHFSIKDGTLHTTWKDIRGVSSAAVVRVDAKSAKNPNIIVTPPVCLTKRPLLWAVDTIRSLSFVGPGPIEWLEGRVFALEDYIRRARYCMLGDSAETVGEVSENSVVQTVLNLPAGLEIGEAVKSEIWPPPPFDPPVFTRRKPGEGTWYPTGPDFIRRLKNAPPAFYRSFVRPDRERPYVTVQLFAMDMRQLELHMVGGVEDPQSTTGSAGDGQIPRQKELMERTVAAFNGAFKTEHGAYGMMVARNVLLPPKDEAATVATLNNGSVVMGTWPSAMPIPEEMYSFRQNMDPLVENGTVNPKKRYLWGFTLGNDLTKMQTVRSGLCMSDKGYLVYAWGEDVTGQTLGIAMNAAGCTYGLHLDMNPFHTTFMYYLFSLAEGSDKPTYRFEAALPQTMYSPHRYVKGASKDFFFLALRDKIPGPDWREDGLAQPTPAFLPSVFRKNAKGCRLIAVNTSRVSAHLTPGAIPEHLAPADHSPENPLGRENLLVDIDLGPWAADRGQIVNDSTAAEIPPAAAVLGVDNSGIPMIASRPFAPTLHIQDALQGLRLSDTDTSSEPVIGIGMKESWIFIAVGPRVDVRTHLKSEGVETPLCFMVEDGDTGLGRVFVRDEKGMMDLNGQRAMESDMTTTHLQISAMPRPLGVRRLESVFQTDSSAVAPSKEVKHDSK